MSPKNLPKNHEVLVEPSKKHLEFGQEIIFHVPGNVLRSFQMYTVSIFTSTVGGGCMIPTTQLKQKHREMQSLTQGPRTVSGRALTQTIYLRITL